MAGKNENVLSSGGKMLIRHRHMSKSTREDVHSLWGNVRSSSNADLITPVLCQLLPLETPGRRR